MFAIHRLISAAVLLVAGQAPAAVDPLLEDAVTTFLAPQLQRLPGKVTVRLEPSAPIPACSRPQIFLPADARVSGRVTVGVRCDTPTRWTLYLPVMVSVRGNFLSAARQLNQGQTIWRDDLTVQEGELTTLPEQTLNDPQQAIGKRTRHGIAAGQPLRRDHLIQPTLIRQGDSVKAILRGDAFAASIEGVALTNAGEGESIKIRTSGGKTLSGIARANGEVELIP